MSINQNPFYVDPDKAINETNVLKKKSKKFENVRPTLILLWRVLGAAPLDTPVLVNKVKAIL